MIVLPTAVPATVMRQRCLVSSFMQAVLPYLLFLPPQHWKDMTNNKGFYSLGEFEHHKKHYGAVRCCKCLSQMFTNQPIWAWLKFLIFLPKSFKEQTANNPAMKSTSLRKLIKFQQFVQRRLVSCSVAEIIAQNGRNK